MFNSTSRQATVAGILSSLRHDIMCGAISDNTMLSENMIAQQFLVSRSSVRTAFQELEADGLIETLKNGRRRVCRVDEKFLEDFCRTRALLECEAVALILQRSEREKVDVSSLLVIVDEIYSALQLEDEAARRTLLQQVHSRFHEQLFILAGNKSLRQCYRSIAQLQAIITSVNATLEPEANEHSFYIAHLKITEMLMSRSKEVIEYMRYHCINAAVHDALIAIRKEKEKRKGGQR